MDRKSFIQILAAIPFIGIPFRSFAGTAWRADSCKTQTDAEGPFYKSAAPPRKIIDTEGETLIISGRVLNADDCQTPVVNATLDIWHCDNHGNYDMQGFKCRGLVKTDRAGNYTFTTILPPPYGTRPRHIHFKIRAQGERELTTQLYFKGDPNIRNDFARHADDSRVIALRSENNVKNGVFNIYL